MSNSAIPILPSPIASFVADDSATVVGPRGEVAHKDHLAHSERLERKLWEVRPGVWCLVGNGLSNQTFIEGPEGLIAIDTGESNEEMAEALDEVAAVTDAPVVAVIYTHFHYVSGTQAALDRNPDADIPIWGHEGIVENRRRMGSEVSAAAGRGLIHQFGMLLPDEGPDALINIGLGMEFRRKAHAPYTPGFVAPTNTIGESQMVDGPNGPTMWATIAGLQVEFAMAPSDADDSITIWFPELSVCVNNLFWPTLFNVFAIRGEEYRDPRLLLTGLDHMISLGAEHQLCAHGPPMSGADAIREEMTSYRDSIQFMWDQTVRGINRGLTLDELIHFVQLPEAYNHSFRTGQFYGIVEHHVRQIHSGLRGWFDGHEATMLAMPPADKARRLIEGFGGADEVRAQAKAALQAEDVRWALELATWLVRCEHDSTGRVDGGTPEDRALLASILRTVAQRTTSANLRNQALTRALELEGTLDLSRFRVHRFGRGDVLANPPELFVHTLRVLLDPHRAEGVDEHIRFEFSDDAGATTGLHVRRGVAVPTDGADAELAISLSLETWATILSTKATLSEALAAGDVTVTGHQGRIVAALSCFDHSSFRPAADGAII
ncbi:MAG: alkyl sulfatase dimerization domain-containing protein [Acidimicrobiales bacterium]